MRCPACEDDFEPECAWCSACATPLAENETLSTARVGRFHPAAARVVIELAVQRGAPVQTDLVGDLVDVRVPKDRRDGLRAELLLTWDALVARLPPQDQAELAAQGGQLPGWGDTPGDVWVDRDGQLRVAPGEEEAEEDTGRIVGPTLVATAILLLLLAWQLGDGHLRLLAAIGGFGMLLVGTFLPR